MSAALSLLLAGTLLTAAVAKLRDPDAFRSTLAALGTRGAYDIHRVSTGPRVVPAVEIALAIALLAGGGRPAALATAALLGLFTAILRVLDRHAIPCHCFGSAPHRSGLARNAALLVAAAALLVAPAAALWTLPLTELFGAAAAATGAACSWALVSAL